MPITTVTRKCKTCGDKFKARLAYITAGRDVKFCSRPCFSKSRRMYRPKSQKVALKQLYDIEYRERNYKRLKKVHAAWFQQDYAKNPKKYKKIRTERMASHIKYCRQPEYKKKKHQYDRKRYAQDKFGDLWEIHVLNMEILEETKKQMSKYEMDGLTKL